ncbi:LysM peptidoglycan-binding domain-containing protein [Flavobacterium columnare]|uniref:LysM peptidoglycan-binding domain-containing protein n=1 Tax=Flavobacterium columnare TaxID=996 RepID=A0AAI8CHX6_9FLAO|nr:LysM peptidoglycan-binding domain-containing protein [Flavobacterium columnare]AMO20489.1 LysM peptidoglycan-binding domain-containing protein [Flavobacterium columnare]AUX18457.1 lytic transglycosylase [Flavobacterium columnare]QOG57540.1 LysM peptidoglycan-binding domain-containing protein [Flavobacterium columnare]QOG60264.1 LysM peptidoglycan-binding domain-containing protein [Flavobacterium columnare]QOG62984.1 LysM peptidoglycan-binding domain-containing protein [Flavobacterium column
MIRKKLALNLFLLVAAFGTYAQNKIPQDSVLKPIVKRSYLDSIKGTFVVNETSDCIDNQHIKELSNTQDIFDGIVSDIKNLDLNIKVDFDLPTDVFKERLRLLDEKSPFNIEYNPQLENLVKNFLKNRKRSYERLMGLSQFYFPLFEEAMARYDVPLEIKYLSIVESALRSSAVSRVGATGLWQFMYETGKQYGLKIDSYIDERKDTFKATDAAARYMQGMYKIFGDWELVLASYNSGAGNVSKAIRRSGGFQNFWNIKHKLPRETQGYVPAFLATMYIFEYHKEHGLVPYKPVAKHFETDTIALKRKVSFKQLASLLDMPESDIEFLNPSYKMKVVPYVTGKNHFICLPKKKLAILASNEDKVYAYIDHQESKRERPFIRQIKPRIVKEIFDTEKGIEESFVNKTESKKPLLQKFHIVKKGEDARKLAEKYNVAIADIKRWNRLRGIHLLKGSRIRIKYDESNMIAANAVQEIEESNPVALTTGGNGSKIKTVDLVNKEVKIKNEVNTTTDTPLSEHTVLQGETLYGIAKKHRLFVSDLKKWNQIENGIVNPGDVIKLIEPKQEVIVQTDLYTVKKGDNFGKIAKNYGVTVDELMQWNDKTSKDIKVGEQLKVEKAIVAKVELPKKKLPFDEQKLYIVQKGDSLFKISKKYNTTVAELRKKNNIKENDLQPGMKIKI